MTTNTALQREIIDAAGFPAAANSLGRTAARVAVTNALNQLRPLPSV